MFQKLRLDTYLAVVSHGQIYVYVSFCFSDDFSNLKRTLEELNQEQKDIMNQHLSYAAEHFLSNIRYRFVDPNGLTIGLTSVTSPLMWK